MTVDPSCITKQEFQTLSKLAITQPDEFWSSQAKKFITWFSPWTQVSQGDFHSYDIQWFLNAKLNASYNCLDRHLSTKAHQIAIQWEGNNPGEHQAITYAQLHRNVNQFANVLKSFGVHKGDRICIYLPMIPEIIIAMLACARIGAIHSVVFAGFSAEALQMRILDADCRLLITADEGVRGEKIIPLKRNVDAALEHCPNVEQVIVVKRTGGAIHWHSRDIWYHEAMNGAQDTCEAEIMDANDPLFILYTSGSTGKPKGILHSTGGYLVYVASTFHYVFNPKSNEIYWCTADIGWITGHSYLVYGPLSQGMTTLLFEGIPNYPNFSRYWQIIDKYSVNIFYTSPTALRALRREGNQWIKCTSRQSLRLLGTVGEPINPEVWEWYHHTVGDDRCDIVNTWWQTETGGIMLTPLANVTEAQPGSAGIPCFGVEVEIVNESGHAVITGETGQLVIKKPWPGLMLTIFNDKERFINNYLKPVPGCYYTGDGAYRDDSGQIWITGRLDDVIKVSGHRIGTAELENAFVSHPMVAEAAVVGIPDEIKGESIYAFIITQANIHPNNLLKQELIQYIREKIGPLATPQTIHWTSALPKTRSGKIMRRILRKIAVQDFDNMGDISTLSDPHVIEQIIKEK